MITIEQIEALVLKEIVESTTTSRGVLACQVSCIWKTDRTFSGAGVVSRFQLSGKFETIDEPGEVAYGNVNGVTPSLANGFGTILFIRDGVIDRLEMYTYGEPWPQALDELQITADSE